MEFDTETIKEILNLSLKKGELDKKTPVGDLAQFPISELYGMMLFGCISNKRLSQLRIVINFQGLQILY